MTLETKIALVTGGSRGIGRAIALRLARDGATAIVHCKSNVEAAEAVVSEIAGAGGRAVALQADLSDLREVRRLAADVEGKFGGLDILVNNAGWATFSALGSVSVETFDTIFSLNVRGLFFLTQELVDSLHDGGRIVNISSGITRINAAYGSVYSGSKAAVEAFTRCWAAELGPRHITVNTVSPGMTETDLLREAVAPDAMSGMAAQTPLGRIGQPADIADVVAYLCSDDARWLTAQNVLANGGV